MSNTLKELLIDDEANQKSLLTDCVQLIDEEVIMKFDERTTDAGNFYDIDSEEKS